MAEQEGDVFSLKVYHECGVCSSLLLLACSTIEQHVTQNHQLTPAQYNTRYMQVSSTSTVQHQMK